MVCQQTKKEGKSLLHEVVRMKENAGNTKNKRFLAAVDAGQVMV